MGKYSDDMIVQAKDADDLSKEVMQYLKDGWILLGLFRIWLIMVRKFARH
jgi:hypothetical protein